MPPRADDPNLVSIAREFLLEMQTCVQAVDFERARPLFADDVVAFGTFASVVSGREALEAQQWRNIWPVIQDFRFRLADLRCLGTTEAVCLVVAWDSLGRRRDGSTFDRPGRATVLLVQRNGRYVALHSHFSLAPAA
jgi:ketosteroid isomerase-like protein